MKKYILSLDQWTTSSRAVLFLSSGEMIGMASRGFSQYYPHPGWVEHDAEEILSSQVSAVQDVLKKTGVSVSDIAAIGITNQRETVVVWDKYTGKPVHPAIVWQCHRTSDMCLGWKQDGLEPMIREKTGLLSDPYFSGSKIKWIFDHDPGIKSKAKRGEVLVGTIDTWLIWNLTNRKSHITDGSNASRTMLYHIHQMKWDHDLLNLMGIPECVLPEVVKSSGVVANVHKSWFGIDIPIAGIAGDQQAALFGQGCLTEGSIKNTYGTGCFILMNTGKKPVHSNNRLLTTIAWDIGDGPVYALEGGVFHAGSAIQWLQDAICMVKDGKEADQLAMSVPDTNGAYFVPAFTGLGAPWWDMYASGTMIGLTRGTTKAHFVRAVLESIAYQSKDVMDAMRLDFGNPFQSLKVDGGISQSDIVLQFQADLLGIEVRRPLNIETTAAGAAMLASYAMGMSDLNSRVSCDISKVYKPLMSKEKASLLYENWKRAVSRSMNWNSLS